jgi:glycosyltransferase involved in cell wall biosynthesis
VLVDVGDIGALARTLCSLFQNQELRESMGERGYEKVISHYTWPAITEKVEKIYVNVVAELGRPAWKKDTSHKLSGP